MKQVIVEIEGMQCGMCEAHINNVIRQNFPVRKVISSHKRGNAVLVVEEEIEEQKLRDVIKETGYQVKAVSMQAYEKKGLFSRRKRS